MTLAPPRDDATRAADVQALHLATYGQPAALVAYAPGRVNLMGDHTDYNDGQSLPIAIDRGTACGVSRRSDGVIAMVSAQGDNLVHEVRIDDLAPGCLSGWGAYVAGSVAMAMERGWHAGGVSISLDGDVPLGAGLSSSAALECAVVLAVAALSGSDPDPMAIALAAQEAEHVYAGVPCGILDQATSMLAQAGEALILDSGQLTATSVPLGLDELGLHVLVVDTNARHELTDGGYASRRAACDEAAATLGVDRLARLTVADLDRIDSLPDPLDQRAHHVVTEHARVAETVAAFAAGDVERIGDLFAQSHWSLAGDFEVSCPELDVAVQAAMAAGAAAARMTGGGFGGSAVVLCPTQSLVGVQEAVRTAFADHGFAAPSFLVVSPSRGAHVISRDGDPARTL